MLRRIWHFHDEERLVRLAQSGPGRVGIVLLAFALLVWHDSSAIQPMYMQRSYLLAVLTIALVMIWPSRPRQIASLGSLVMLVGFAAANFEIIPEALGATALLDSSVALIKAVVFLSGVLGLLYALHRVTQGFERLPDTVRKYPVLTFHCLALSSLVFIDVVPALAFLTAYTWLLAYLIWRIGYMILDASRGVSRGTRFSDHLFYLAPVFDGQPMFVGKGFAYLSRHQADNPEDLARSQLAGLRLLGIGVVWFALFRAMMSLVYGKPDQGLPFLSGWSLNLPLMTRDMDAAAQTTWSAWVSLYLELFRVVLFFAAWGAMVVGCVRLLGFNVFRNTYKPLLAQNLLDFWGRFLYYFKEVCVDFFFYPAFARCAWAGYRLRLFIAVFAAAGIGNFYIHLLYFPNAFIAGQWSDLVAYWAPRTVYCALLAIGVWVSMLRQQRRRASDEGEPRPVVIARRIFGVWTFYAVIHVFNIQNPRIDLTERIRFCAALIGL